MEIVGAQKKSQVPTFESQPKQAHIIICQNIIFAKYFGISDAVN